MKVDENFKSALLASVPRKSRDSLDSLSSQDSKDSSRSSKLERREPHQVDELEKRWCYAASACELENLKTLYKVDNELINKKDYFTTAIHWASKRNRIDVIRWLYEQRIDTNIRTPITICERYCVQANLERSDLLVNKFFENVIIFISFIHALFCTISFTLFQGGYTPLHVAAMHGKENIIRDLVQYYEADINLRDYSGRKARNYLKHDSSQSIKRMLEATPSVLDVDLSQNTTKFTNHPLSSSNNVPSIKKDLKLENLKKENIEEIVKKKKRTLSITQSFKHRRKTLIEKRSTINSRDSPVSPRKQRSSSDIQNGVEERKKTLGDQQYILQEQTNITPQLRRKGSASEHIINGYAGFINNNKYHRKLPQSPTIDTRVTEQQWNINTWV
ncbi:ankyrin repeat domain-containing protein SOWAHD-like [Hydractinia symbiolongicarpus]|uniref:ankyrin repeat domain-containing protein SOWAHD-like n=1 Tax=Hydractinia symbiolongicarpus TaxID=13093 RepID=UPI002551AA59|nr:ankyrin repeat domain-containing protein SOWAHD-like [Hydractinia symbiolongicarpus]